MHGGRCQDFGSGLNCTCPVDYTGIGCQYEYDACAAGACQNGATCIDHGPGYTCICPTGFTGNWKQKIFHEKIFLNVHNMTSDNTFNLKTIML